MIKLIFYYRLCSTSTGLSISMLQLATLRTNSLWPSDAIYNIWTMSQVTACCLMAPSHYQNQCWLFISEDLWYSPDSEGNFTRNAENCQFKITATSPRDQWEFYLQDRSALESSFQEMACCLLRADSSFLSTEPNHLKTKFSEISKSKYFLINKMPLEMLPANQQPFYSGIYVLTLSDLSQGELKVQWCSIFHGHWYHNTVEPLYNTVHYHRY